MRITEQQLEQYRDNGYLVIRNFIPAAELAPLRQRLVEIVDGDHDWAPHYFQIADPARFQNPKGGPLPVGIQRPATREEVFAGIAHHANLQDVMSGLLGGPVELFTDQTVVRHSAFQSGGSFYHQDSYYWHLPPETGCNAWITLDEVGPEAGALAVLPGTHRDWQLVPHESYYDDPTAHAGHTGEAYMRHRIPADEVDFSREDLLHMQPGDAVFFTNYTWHRAEGNLTGRHKFAYAIAYRTAASGPAESGAK